MSEFLSRVFKEIFEIVGIFGDAIGGRTLHVGPHELIGVQLRGVSGKEVRMNMGTTLKEFFDRSSFVRTPSVPEKDEPFSQMAQKMLEKTHHFGMTDVLQRMKTDIQSNPPFACRDTDRGDSRDLGPSPGNFKNRSLSDRRPGLSDCGDKTEPALVEKDQRDFKPFGLFLYAARHSASTALFPFHLALEPWFRASDSSSPTLVGSSRHERGDRRHQSDHQSPRRFSLGSKGRLSTPGLTAPSQELSLETVSGARLVYPAVPEQVLASKRLLPFSYEDRSNNRLNLTSNRAPGLFGAGSFLHPRAPRPAAYAFQALSGFHVVS